MNNALNTLIIRFFFIALAVVASTATASNSEPLKDCSVERCKTDDGIVVEIISKGESESAKTVRASDRRVDISLKETTPHTNQPQGKGTVSGEFLIRTPLGGIFWATEDPAITQPRLSVNAPQMMKFSAEQVYPVRFNYFTNYQAFIDQLELSVYQGHDTDLVSPIFTKRISEIESFGDISWESAPDKALGLAAGDTLIYVLRAYDKAGNMDETQPKTLQLVTPQEYDSQFYTNQSTVSSNASQTVSQGKNSYGISDLDQTGLANYGQNQLLKQNIPIQGSRVRIFGQDIPKDYTVEINGRSMPVDLQRKMAAEYLLPIGQHQFLLTLSGEGGTAQKTLNVDVTGKYMFLAALADLTASKNKVSGSIEALSSDDRYQDDFLVEGRLAFYLKGKIKGKYLVTAQADTQERKLSKLFNGFLDKDPVDIFRRLDPDKYYPVYGDDSTTTRDVDSQGRLYVRVDWDKSMALWGNFNTGITGSEISQYNRSLYGGALNWKSSKTTVYGETKQQLKLFASEAQTALGHSEFLGTGGSLYYLKHTDILQGSDKLAIEIRDPNTGLTVERIDLVRDADYEIDEFQGRIILSRPLFSFTRDDVTGIIRNQPLDGNQLFLLVDYEYLPAGFDPDHLATGGRVKKWFGDHVGIGLTYVDENRAGDDYQLAGADITLQAGKGTYLKLEQAKTSNSQSPVFYSDNGGLTFSQTNPATGQKKGDAQVVEGRINFKELGLTKRDVKASAWHRKTDAGYSIARRDLANKVTEQGVELYGQYSRKGSLQAQVTKKESGTAKLTQAALLMQHRLSAATTLVAEIKQVQETQNSTESDALLAALEYRQRVTPTWELYGVAQGTIEADDNYKNNDLYTLGTKYLLAGRSSLGAEYTTGHRGDAASLNGEYQINNANSVYSRYSWTTDSTSPFASSFNKNGLTLGHRSRIGSDLSVYNETQMINSGKETGFVHVFGMNYYLSQGWNLGASLQHGELELDTGEVDRNAATVSVGFTDSDLQWASKLEYRQDKGAEARTQWLTTNRIRYIINPSWRVAAKYNYADTEDELESEADTKFIEASLGFAYRPADNNRWNALGKYTYLYDLRSLSQTNFGTDQKSDIFTLEGTYRFNPKWEMAAKLGRRSGELRAERGVGEFFKSTVNFAALQGRYHLVKNWDALLEYRILQVKQSNSTRKGWLVGVDRHIGEHFKLGVGYNFTDFSDDLRVTDYQYKGWFINLLGKY